MLEIKFQLKLGAGNDYSHQRGINKIPLGITLSRSSQSEKADKELWSQGDSAGQPSAFSLTRKPGGAGWKKSKPLEEVESRLIPQGH